MDVPSRAGELRKLLNTTLKTDSDFDAFCLDYFPYLYKRFTFGMDRTMKLNMLLELVPHAEISSQLKARFPEVIDETNQGIPIRERRDLLRLLDEVLEDDTKLIAFCLDYFPAVQRKFSPGMSFADRMTLLWKIAPHHELLQRIRELKIGKTVRVKIGTAAADVGALGPAPLATLKPDAGSERNAAQLPCVWFSYAEEEEVYAAELREHLDVLEMQGLLQIYVTPISNRNSPPPLLNPAVIILLLSRKYLALGADHIEPALALHRGPRNPTLLLVQLAPALWKSTPLAAFGPPLFEGRGVLGFTVRDEAWIQVAEAVRRAIQFPATTERELPQAPAMATRVKSMADVFVYAGPSTVSFVETRESRELVRRLRLPTIPDGLVVEGPSGIGKTTAVLRALKELQAEEKVKYLSGSSEADRSELERQVLQEVPQAGYLVIDDFHLLLPEHQAKLSYLVKRLCDRNRQDTKVVIVGISPIGASLSEALPDIRGRYTSIRLHGRQPDEKIDELITLGERAANVEFVHRSQFIGAAGGSLALAQRLCYEATRLADITEPPTLLTPIHVRTEEISKRLLETLKHDYRPHLLTFASWDDANQPAPRGACLYLLCELTDDRDNNGSIQVNEVELRYKRLPEVSAAFKWLLASNLATLFEERSELRRLLYYNRRTKALSAEDPQLWFYLREINWVDFARDSGHAVELMPDLSGRPILKKPAAKRTTTRRTKSTKSGAPFVLVHLSDLHCTTPEQARRWYSQLADDLRREQSIEQVDALVLSGDLVNIGKEAEYLAADQFLTSLMKDFNIGPHQLLIVPGNHDLDWGLAKDAYRVHVRKDYKGTFRPDRDFEKSSTSDYIEVREDEFKYRQRFEPFAQFYQRNRRQPYSLDPALQWQLSYFASAGILLLGLNSAWNIDHNFAHRSSINLDALSRGLDDIRLTADYAACRIKIAVFHHPVGGIDDARLRDLGFLERLSQAGFRVILHGHVHEADDWQYSYYRQSGLHILGAGTLGAAADNRPESVPLHYQVLQLTSNTLTIRSRQRKKESGAWEADYRYRPARGKPPTDTISIRLP